MCGDKHATATLIGACDYPRISLEPKWVALGFGIGCVQLHQALAASPARVVWKACCREAEALNVSSHLRRQHGDTCCARRTLYPKVVRARPQTPNLHQVFVLPAGPFEFGPLLAARPPPQLPDAPDAPAPEAHPDHVACLRIANCGLFSLHADFWLKSEGDPATEPPGRSGAKRAGAAGAAASGGGKGGKAGATPPAPPSAVALHPRSLELGIGASGQLHVYCFPQAEGPLEDSVMCRWGSSRAERLWLAVSLGDRPLTATVAVAQTAQSAAIFAADACSSCPAC
jgi:hypothetical protein